MIHEISLKLAIYRIWSSFLVVVIVCVFPLWLHRVPYSAYRGLIGFCWSSNVTTSRFIMHVVFDHDLRLNYSFSSCPYEENVKLFLGIVILPVILWERNQLLHDLDAKLRWIFMMSCELVTYQNINTTWTDHVQ